MTALDAQPSADVVTRTDAPASNRRARTFAPEAPLRRVVIIALVALLVIAIGLATFFLFERPVAESWYTTRQHNLASRLAAKGVHRGNGSAIALLQIPTLGTNLVVAEGDSAQQLRSGPGHRPRTPAPGDIGNSVIVGHRSGWGAPLDDVAKLQPGQFIVVQTRTPDGLDRNAVFIVRSVQRVSATDTAPFANSTDHRLTIVTGAGGRFSEDRLVVTAVSGPAGRVLASGAISARIPTGSPVLNAEALLALGCFVGALGLGLLLRRRYHAATVAAIMLPLLAVGILGTLLAIDTALPPLR